MMVTKVVDGSRRTAFLSGVQVFDEVGISIKDIEEEMHRNPAWAAAENEMEKTIQPRSCSSTRSSHACGKLI